MLNNNSEEREEENFIVLLFLYLGKTLGYLFEFFD